MFGNPSEHLWSIINSRSDISRIPYSQPSWKFYFSAPDLVSDHHVFHKFKMAITKRNALKKLSFFPSCNLLWGSPCSCDLRSWGHVWLCSIEWLVLPSRRAARCPLTESVCPLQLSRKSFSFLSRFPPVWEVNIRSAFYRRTGLRKAAHQLEVPYRNFTESYWSCLGFRFSLRVNCDWVVVHCSWSIHVAREVRSCVGFGEVL